jgi:hypothetical protein
MVQDEVKYIKEFPQSFTLQNKSEVNIDLIGMKSFVVYDSIMIVSTGDSNGIFSILSLPECKDLGSFLTKGDGPFEFIWPPSVNNMKLVRENGRLRAIIYDFQKGKLLKVDIDKLIKDKEVSMEISKKSLPPFLFNLVMMDSTSFFCKRVNDIHTQQIRYILNNNDTITTPIMQRFNQASIREREDINTLGTMTKINFDKKLIVEMPVRLNYLNIYSLDGTWGKTICVGDELYDMEKLQDKDVWDRIYTYADLRLFDNFWGVVCIDEDQKTYQIGRKKLPSILLFDWQGEPLAELKLEHFITSFDIDFKNGVLYTMDVHSDEFYKYDVRDILDKISPVTL